MPETKDFIKLKRNVSKQYFGKKVPLKYQKKYGKIYGKKVPLKYQKKYGKIYGKKDVKGIAFAIAKLKKIKID